MSVLAQKKRFIHARQKITYKIHATHIIIHTNKVLELEVHIA